MKIKPHTKDFYMGARFTKKYKDLIEETAKEREVTVSKLIRNAVKENIRETEGVQR